MLGRGSRYMVVKAARKYWGAEKSVVFFDTTPLFLCGC